jgi:hypothetical protein
MVERRKEQVNKLTRMLKADGKQKVSKVRNQYGIVQNMSEHFEYLNGRKVRVIKGPNPDLLYGVIQHPGYEGLVVAFKQEELKLIQP